MDLSGIIFVVLAIAWAVFLIPKALKQHDEVARTRSIDRFSGALRVLAHREPVDARSSRLVVTPRPAPALAPAARSAVPVEPAVVQSVEAPGSSARAASRRTAARVAARRRRRVLMLLLLCDVAVAVAAYLVYVPRWSVAIPGGLTLVWLALCRGQARRERARGTVVPTARRATVGQEVPAQPEQELVVEEVVMVRVGEKGIADVDEAEDTMGIPVADLEAALAPEVDAGGTLWDPLPVTLPTYVTKPKAQRTVRTIDLGEPGTWTSGRTPEDAEIAARATEGAASKDGSSEGGRRVVGG